MYVHPYVQCTYVHGYRAAQFETRRRLRGLSAGAAPMSGMCHGKLCIAQVLGQVFLRRSRDSLEGTRRRSAVGVVFVLPTQYSSTRAHDATGADLAAVQHELEPALSLIFLA